MSNSHDLESYEAGRLLDGDSFMMNSLPPKIVANKKKDPLEMYLVPFS